LALRGVDIEKLVQPSVMLSAVVVVMVMVLPPKGTVTKRF
jgi:hypothetical protein